MDKKILKASGIVGIGTIISQILGFLFFTILARYYSQSDYGFINYTISVAALAATIVTAGYPSSLVRFIAKHKGKQEVVNEYFSSIITINAGLLFLVIIGVIVIYGFDIGILSIVIGYSVVYIYLGMIRGFIHYTKIALFNILRNLLKIVALIILSYILYIKSPISIILLYAFGGWIVILILELLYPTKIRYSTNFISRKKIIECTKFSIPIMISTYAYSLLTYSPIIALKYFVNDYSIIGIFATAMTLTMVFGFIPLALITITMPTISTIENKKMRIKYTTQSLWIVIISGFFIFACIYVFGENILEFFFTEKYIQSYPILLILSIGAIFSGIRTVFSSLWEGSGTPIISSYDIIVASIICIAMSYLLIPTIGSKGAAYGYSCGLVASVIVDSIFWIRYRYTIEKT